LEKKSTLKIDENLSANDAIRDAVDAFTNSDTPVFDLLIRENEKKKFVKLILSGNVERKQADRQRTTDILYHLHQKGQLSNNQMLHGFSEFRDTCDEDFLLDCPKGDEYIGEFLSAVVDPPTVIAVIKDLSTSRRITIFASCLRAASTRATEDVSKAYSKARIDWVTLEASDFKDFCKKNKIAPLKELSESEKLHSAILERNFDEIRSICESNASKSKEFLSQIVSSVPDAIRQDIDGLVSIVKKLADSEKDLINRLEKATEKEAFTMWLLSLLQHKHISRESIQNYSTSLLSKSGHKDAANQVLRFKNGRL